MQAEVYSDANQSTADFIDLVAPVLQRPGWPTRGEIVSVEYLGERVAQLVSDRLRDVLDMNAGIDFIQVAENGCLRGIASRVQPCEKAWDTFTIRARRVSGAKTELDKRTLAFGPNERWRGWIVPYFTIQAYVYAPPVRGIGLERSLLSVGVTMTRDLIEYVDANEAGDAWYWQRTGNAWFIVVPWDAYRASGKRLWRHP